MLKTYLNNWTWKRLLQLAFGFFLFYKYQESGNIAALLFGGLMILQAVLNIGCFSSRGCSNTVSNHPDKDKELDEIDVEVEEIK